MIFCLQKRATLLIPSGPRDLKHLHVILTDECPNGQVLVVPISSIRKGQKHDPACELKPGEHTFVEDPSYIIYRLANTLRCTDILTLINNHYYGAYEEVSTRVFARICNGLLQSDFAKPWTLKYYDDNK